MSNKMKQNDKPAERRLKRERIASRNADNASVALRYAALGFQLSPLYGTKDGKCTCGDPGCNQPGRHPRTLNATSDPLQVRRMWTTWPKAKIGIALGTTLLALTTDDDAARQRLRELIGDHQKLPRTVTICDHEAQTFLFKGDRHLRRGDLTDGVRILGEGDFIVAPSRFESTGKRRFKKLRSPEQVEIAPTPGCLLAISAKQSASASTGTPQVQASTLVVVSSSEIEPKAIQWVWPGVLARGRVTALVGHRGLGKSQVAIAIAATTSTGRDWPGDVTNDSAANVIMLSTDDAAATVVPRLMAAGADRTRIQLVTAIKEDNGPERAFNLALDLDRLEKEYDLSKVKLVLIDADVRSVLARLTTVAQRHELAVLTVQHLDKRCATRDIIGITGSLEWAGTLGAVFLVTSEAGTARRLFLPLNNNLSPDPIGYAFNVVSKIIGTGISTSAVAWSNDPVRISADEALAKATMTSTSGVLVFLRDALSDGPMDQTEVVQHGQEAGYTPKQLRTAREKLGVKPRKKPGRNGKWEWSLPGGAPEPKPFADDDPGKQAMSNTGYLANATAEGDDMRGHAQRENGGSLKRQ